MSTIELVAPASSHESGAMAFAEEVMAFDGEGIHGSCELYDTRSYSHWLENVTLLAAGRSLPSLSPSATFFAIRPCDGRIVGIINLRYSLDSEFMLLYGGHVGYTVRPTERRKGYAAQMLRQICRLGAGRGLSRLIITCDSENPASARTIESCGGVLENTLTFPGTDELVSRYIIDL